MMRMLRLLVLLPFALSGCAAIAALDQASEPLAVYELRTPAAPQTAPRRRGVELVVEQPVASGALATERIMIRPAPLQAEYLPGVRWADSVPVMLQTLIVRSVSDTAALSSVGRRPIGVVADYAVLSELTDFQAETAAEGAAPAVRARLIVRLVRERDARVIATRTFSVTEVAAGTDTASLVAAFDRTTARLLSDLVPWLLANAT